MDNTFSTAVIVMLAALAFNTMPAQAANPIANEPLALQALLAASTMTIPDGLGCSGFLPGIKKPTIGDLIAVHMTAMSTGANTVYSHCEGNKAKTCKVAIYHAAGEEDLSSLEFHFKLIESRLDVDSMTCLTTP